MKAFLYNSETFQFNGEIIVCQNPEEPDKWLLPAFSTLISPINNNYEKLYWNEKKQEWYEKESEKESKNLNSKEFNIQMLYEKLSNCFNQSIKQLIYIGNFDNKERFISICVRDKLALLANTFITFADTLDLELDNEKITLSKNEFMSILSVVHHKYEELYWKKKDMEKELSTIKELSETIYNDYNKKIDDLFMDNELNQTEQSILNGLEEAIEYAKEHNNG